MKVMVNGLPGKMATKVVQRVLKTGDFELMPYGLTGPEITDEVCTIDGIDISLITPERRGIMDGLMGDDPFLSVDFTQPGAVNGNADFYCSHGLDFVMGTTGGDRDALSRRVRDSDVVAVIAPNMAKQVVAFQSMMQYAADNFPDAFRGYHLEVVESHQQAKKDVSGTAKAMLGYFNKLGIPFTPEQIRMVRDPKEQLATGVPEYALGGHGWHTYTLRSEGGDVLLRFTHDINGRDVYVAGTMDALGFLQSKVLAGEKGKVYSMMDVLRGK